MKNYLTILIAVVVLGGVGVFGYLNMNKSSNNTPPKQSESTQAQPVTSDIKEFVITAKDWQFDPPEIKVKAGDKIRIRAKSVDVTHGFALPQFNVNLRLEPNNEMTAEFTADKKGEFSFFCNVPCGQGHKEMKGTLIVE